MGKHTKLPVKSIAWGETISIIGEGKEDFRIAVINHSGEYDKGIPSEKDRANAKFIVKACNSHYDLLEACKTLLARLENTNINTTIQEFDGKDILKQAIAKAEKEA